MISVKLGSRKWFSNKQDNSNNCTAIMLVFLNSMERKIIMSAYIPVNPLMPASYLMAEYREYSTLIEQKFCIFNYLLFSYFEKPDT
jgi:hypothetical protein